MFYDFFRPILFRLSPENAHALALNALKYSPAAFFPKSGYHPVEAMGLKFSHPVGLAAGLDKNGSYIDALGKLGFSFIEIGTTTPRPQPGNPKPRLFRIPEAAALINRMGFNNLGVDVLLDNVKRARFQGVLGINIGKNKTTELNQAAEDYLYCLEKVYPYASYVTINISSPNTPGLRELQQQSYLSDLLGKIHQKRQALAEAHQQYKPLVLKISPDETEETLKQIAQTALRNQFEGMIISNTTADHSAVEKFQHGQETGGLSGRVMAPSALASLRLMKSYLGNDMTLIASGGIDSPQSFCERLAAGASLVQIYTGLIYQGPALVTALSRTAC